MVTQTLTTPMTSKARGTRIFIMESPSLIELMFQLPAARRKQLSVHLPRRRQERPWEIYFQFQPQAGRAADFLLRHAVQLLQPRRPDADVERVVQAHTARERRSPATQFPETIVPPTKRHSRSKTANMSRQTTITAGTSQVTSNSGCAQSQMAPHCKITPSVARHKNGP